jgi:hypothetical protein
VGSKKIAVDRKPGEVRSRKRHPLLKKVTSGNALIVVAVLAWLLLIVDLAAHVLDAERHADLRAIAATSALIAAFGRFTRAFVRTMRAHTSAMTEHVLAVERFWDLSARADAHAKRDALKATGTGPMKIVRS